MPTLFNILKMNKYCIFRDLIMFHRWQLRNNFTIVFLHPDEGKFKKRWFNFLMLFSQTAHILTMYIQYFPNIGQHLDCMCVWWHTWLDLWEFAYSHIQFFNLGKPKRTDRHKFPGLVELPFFYRPWKFQICAIPYGFCSNIAVCVWLLSCDKWNLRKHG